MSSSADAKSSSQRPSWKRNQQQVATRHMTWCDVPAAARKLETRLHQRPTQRETLESLRLTEVGIGNGRVLDRQPELESDARVRRASPRSPPRSPRSSACDSPHPQRAGRCSRTRSRSRARLPCSPTRSPAPTAAQRVEGRDTAVGEYQGRVSSFLEERDSVSAHLTSALRVSMPPEDAAEVHHREPGCTRVTFATQRRNRLLVGVLALRRVVREAAARRRA